jgi:hypothetical protein
MTYYEWGKKGLSAMMKALTDGDAGRPHTRPEDAEKKALKRRLAELEPRIQSLFRTFAYPLR